MEGLWQRTADRIRDSLGQVGFETWIGPLNFLGMQGRIATIEAPNRFFRDWVSDRYLELLRQSLSAEVGQTVDVKLTLGLAGNGNLHEAVRRTLPPTASSAAEAAPRDRHPHLNERYTFAEFVVGSANQFAHAAALAVANQPGEKYTPLFIYGGVGLGKTHLVTAIGHHLWNSGKRKVLFLPTEVFMNELITSLRRDRMGEFKEKFRRVDVLILDDVQFLAGRERTQEEFFHTFNSLYDHRRQIVLTSDKVPKDIPDLEERLRNRFEWGLIADIQPPDVETRVAIIEKKAEMERIPLPHDVALFLGSEFSANVRELEGSLTRLGAHASLAHRPITVEFAREVLQAVLKPQTPKVSFDEIVTAVCSRFSVRPVDLRSKRRSKNVVMPRQLAMYLCRRLMNVSFPHIGELFARDHSTVIHATTVTERRIKEDAAFQATVERLERSLREH
jgi:chromosomal replication initiator protein